MRNKMLLLASLLLPSATGLSSPSLAARAPLAADRVCVVDRFRQPEAPVTNKVDVLFVMDNSESMNRHWQLMATKIDRLIRAYPANSDLRFAVVLGTMTKFNGQLYSAKNVPTVLDGTKLSPAQISAYLRRTFREALNYTDPTGAGEALFYSLYYAVTSKAKENQARGFFRPDAALQVMLMSDDAEIGTKYPSRQPWGLPPKCNYLHHESVRRSHYLPRGISTATTLQAMRRLKGELPVVANAYVNITKEDILVDNRLDAECIYDSPGYGYFDMVKKSGGVLYSIHRDRGRGLELAGQRLATQMELRHDFLLSKPADKVDPASIEARVDESLKPHTYDALSNRVHLEDAGRPGSAVTIRHCEPIAQQEWNLTGFEGDTSRTTAALRWQTVEHATRGRLFYGLSPDALDRSVDSALATDHRLNVEGLTPNTAYYFQAMSWDEFGQERRSEVIALSTRPDWAAPVLAGEASRSSAALRWSTEYPTEGRIFWGTDPADLDQVTSSTPSGLEHQVLVESLRAGTTYYFQALVADSFGWEKRSQVLALRTVDDWSIVGFEARAGRTTAEVRWQTPEYDTVGELRYGLSPEDLNGVVASPSGRTHLVALSDLSPGTRYYLRASARDDLGVVKETALLAITTAADWRISDEAVTAAETSFTLAFSTRGYATNGFVRWGLSADNLSETAPAGEGTADHRAEVSRLAPDTLYYAQAVAVDDLGERREGAVLAIRTKAEVPPLPTWAITDLYGLGSTHSVRLNWLTEGYPTRAVVRYGLRPNELENEQSEDGSAREHSLEFTGLDPDTTYYFQVEARDDRGQTQSSPVISLRTQAIPLPTWEITDVGAAPAVRAVRVDWRTVGQATHGEVRWGTTADSLPNAALDPVIGEAHSININNLSPDTLYYFRVIARDDFGQEKSSEVVAMRTLPAPQPTWRIQSFDGTTTRDGAAIIWQTPGAATRATLRIGLRPDDLTWRAIEVTDFKTVHLVNVTDLSPNTAYYFQVTAEDELGNRATSGVLLKRTQP